MSHTKQKGPERIDPCPGLSAALNRRLAPVAMVTIMAVMIMAVMRANANHNLSLGRRDDACQRDYGDQSDHPTSNTCHVLNLQCGLVNPRLLIRCQRGRRCC
jgi:hypothetical protein